MPWSVPGRRMGAIQMARLWATVMKVLSRQRWKTRERAANLDGRVRGVPSGLPMVIIAASLLLWGNANRLMFRLGGADFGSGRNTARMPDYRAEGLPGFGGVR